MRTKTRTVSITNAQIGIAVAAAVLSGGLAFAAIPSFQNTVAKECQVKSIAVTQSCIKKTDKQTRATIICGNGKSIAVDQKACLTKQQLETGAATLCKDACVVKKAVPPKATPQAAAPPAPAQPAPLQLAACGPIAAAGTYVLTQDINIPVANTRATTCFQLPNNTILDCQNHTIFGNDTNITTGVSVGGSGSTVKNCNFSGISFSIGFNERGVQGNALNNTITNARDTGIYVHGIGNRIENNRIIGSQKYGIEVYFSQNSHIVRNTISSSTIDGMYLTGQDGNNIFEENGIDHSGAYGMELDAFSNGNIFNSNRVEYNSEGIHLNNSRHNTFTSNQISHSNHSGVSLVSTVGSGNDPQVNTFDGNTVTQNVESGIYVNTEENTFVRNVFTANQREGIKLNGGSRNTLEDNTFDTSATMGLFLSNAVGNTIRHNQFQGNGTFNGLVIDFNSDQNSVENNTFSHNYVGVSIMKSSRNSISNNTLTFNDTGVKLVNNAVDTSVHDNTFRQNTSHGIFLGYGANAYQREQLGRDIGPPIRTSLSNNIACGNAVADVFCEVQVDTNGSGNSLNSLTPCQEGSAIHIDYNACQ